MKQNFSGAVLLLILAAAGLHTGTWAAWWFAGVSAGFAFVAEDFRNYRSNHGGTVALVVGEAFAVGSWVAIAIAATALLV
jgi:hypothetical protein